MERQINRTINGKKHSASVEPRLLLIHFLRERALNTSLFAKLYRCDPETVRFFECDNALAFKFSIPRPIFQGDLGDGDLHGGQQFMPLLDLEIP